MEELAQPTTPSSSLADRLALKTSKTEECWNWTGSKDTNGYGRIRVAGKQMQVHRIAWELEHGSIPDNLVVDHRCRNRGCLRADHLQVVTQKQNTENQSLSKLSTSGVRGVSWHSKKQKWHARVGHNGRRHSAGYWDRLQDAERAAVALRNRLHTNNLTDRAAA